MLKNQPGPVEPKRYARGIIMRFKDWIFLLGNFNRIDTAIEHKNIKSFRKSLKQTVENCNSCHVAVGSPSMKVVLDARDALSMRHSHELGKSDKPGKHTHMHN